MKSADTIDHLSRADDAILAMVARPLESEIRLAGIAFGEKRVGWRADCGEEANRR